MKKSLLLLLVAALLFCFLLMGTGCEEFDDFAAFFNDETAARTEKQNTPSATSKSQPSTQSATPQGTEGQPSNQTTQADPEYFKRAAVTAMTNYNAVDIFDNGGKVVQSKLHKYSDTSGEPELYFMYVTSWGTWTAQGENAWHVETMELKSYGGYQDDYRFNLDVRFDKSNDAYIVSNVYEFCREAGKSSFVSVGGCVSSHELFRVPSSFVTEDRNGTAVKALDHSGLMNETRGRMAFENYANSYFSYYGCKVKANRYITHLQDYTGSWYFVCEITVTYSNGSKEQMKASAYINVATQAVEEFEVFY